MEHTTDDLAPRHFAKIVDSSDDAIVSKDLNGIILSWNAAAERMFGYTAAEAIGQSIRIIIPDVRQSEEDFVLGQIRAGKSVRHYETVRQRKDGTLIPISLTSLRFSTMKASSSALRRSRATSRSGHACWRRRKSRRPS
jgi:PAS domain S-box-containing protein